MIKSINPGTLIPEIIDMINADAFADLSDIQDYYNSRFDISLAPAAGEASTELTARIAIKAMQLFRALFDARVAVVNAELKPDAVDTSKARGKIIVFGSCNPDDYGLPNIMNGGRLFDKYFNR